MLNTREVGSQPSMAWANNIILLQTARPSTLCAYLMFQHRGLFFVPDLTSGLKKTSQEASLTWKYRSTARSVSSPTRVVSQDIAYCTVVSGRSVWTPLDGFHEAYASAASVHECIWCTSYAPRQLSKASSHKLLGCGVPRCPSVLLWGTCAICPSYSWTVATA